MAHFLYLPRKRSRTDSFQSVKTPPKNHIMRPRFAHDDTYYFEDGSCILLVEEVLFNVHRSRLSMDSSSFATMFSLPRGEQPVEGTSDNNPIVLPGDSAADFRHFLWSLYALPSELGLVTSASANLDQLVAIARISHKYEFRSIENWALDAIQEYINRKPFPILIPTLGKASRNPTTVNTQQLTSLIRLAQLCNHESLLNTLIASLKSLMVDSVQYSYLALTLADELGLRSLRGVAYLQVMHNAVIIRRPSIDVIHEAAANQPSLALGTSLPITPPAPEIEPERVSLTAQQQLRLLAGYYRLTETWEELRKTPPHFEHSVACGATWHQHGCTQSWVEFWREKTKSDTLLSLGLADVIGRLKQIAKAYEKWGSATYMHHDCRQAAKASINLMIKRVEDALPDYFSEAD